MTRQLKQLKMVLSIAILIVTTCTQLAYASRSQLENGYLVVPRIDFDGYGALELTFRLDFDGEWVLILEQATRSRRSSRSFRHCVREFHTPTRALSFLAGLHPASANDRRRS